MIGAGALIFLTGCGNADGGSKDVAAEAPDAQVALAVPDGSVDVSPVVPLEITVTDGELGDVTLVDGAGAAVAGTVAAGDGADGAVWTPEAPLDYGTEYTLTASAVNEDDEEVTASSTFTTVTPETLSTPSIGPLDGQTVGVGMPIRVYFDDPVADKAAVESHLKVTTSRPTDGVWSWLGDAEVHFRPSQYWPADTEVTLDANLYGVDFGEGVWGEKNRSVSFSIGARHVSIADAATHTLEVYDGDRLVQSYPMSAGGPEFPSRNGPHVVTELNRERVMDSSTFGVPVDSPNGYRTPVEYAVRLSNNGEFVHAAPWSVAQQGNSNVSHGCINLSTERAAWFYEFSQPGDVVEIKNSIGPDLSAADGDIYDWTIPWEEWQAGSALK
ncbi:peptidoglycan transpeptidase precursor, ErfK-YbiS-YhnG family [Blastococcus mobilis]|uniref:Peptidoglycan transpeptidase, ErfK-YbiS-YhnG family n=2 Tax=Blastococcus mobilis TaxID=1938746 RepID=A0A238XMD6_9ACTN|nr:peptidoglycan transpeptidase precursor, ErfK-YbiS-YhnG family [Blastococcus mobilis]